MIVRSKQRWFRLLLTWHGSVLPTIWRRVLFVTVLAALVTAMWSLGQPERDISSPRSTQDFIWLLLTTLFAMSPLPFQLVGFVLGIFLGFRSNECYQRFWEARRLWGGLVNVARTFARQAEMHILGPEHERPVASWQTPGAVVESTTTHVAPRLPEAEALRVRLTHDMIAYCHALRHALRKSAPWDDLGRFYPPEVTTPWRRLPNVPLAIVQRMGRQLAEAFRQGWIREYHYGLLDRSLTEILSLQGGCERIDNTPIPFSYSVMMHRIVAVYCLLLPFGIVEQVGLMTPLVVLFISYTFFGLDAISGEVEHPFGTDANDLALDSITTTIEISLRQMLGEDHLPEPKKPVRGVLL